MKFLELQNKLRQLNKEAALIRRELTELGPTGLKPFFQQFFEKHPEFVAIRWLQYTPYFSDGDPCHFSVNDFCPEFTKEFWEAHRNEQWKNEYSHEHRWFESCTYYLDSSPVSQAAKSALKEFRNSLDSDILEAIFGDHVQIEISPAGISVEEYCDHE